ncbi:DDE-type integrase/transposase/recombinase [Candidatus Mycoplasma mahonii]|uniref:DDE-type integrase/transposase/recombinase n=1 Tax=Candidatus Mycoplasma mahonii TaxID=3004105 RepID=UPI0026EDDA85|nr:DDE-type integrase/transposase/recombinase [Candidatus Mycoplasma mahonii]WKX02731.1 DDE-type integrase/transposase/recombinase [Candidatus Mycoplasma mahonii]
MIIAMELKAREFIISDRTFRNYMNRWKLEWTTRKKKRKSENKNTTVEFQDLVKRNFNPAKDNIITTDVSYIPAKCHTKFYLFVVISHKNKLIESYKLSMTNNTKLVSDTLETLTTRENMIVHSDHGSQYSTTDARRLSKKKKCKISMRRVGNSLDNR